MSASPCFALLDDARTGQARVYDKLHTQLICPDAAALGGVLDAMQSHLRQGRHAVLLASYESGAALQNIPPWPQTSCAAAQILIFDDMQLLDAAQLQTWLAQAPAAPAGILDSHLQPGYEEYAAKLAQIHDWLEQGHSYQINFTCRLACQAYGDVRRLYARLRARQPAPYGALLALPDGQALLSLSPELFLRKQGQRLLAQPMKGTAPASDDAQQNQARAAALAADPKNRAENLMIVDLLRNDLGAVARTGSVCVPALFEVARFGGVLQMTSNIEAELRPEVDLRQLLQALFPCGSITGAPKRRTMEIIRALETGPRGWYTGALGWFAPHADAHKIGDFCLSVPIRTLHLQAPDQQGLRAGVLGVGSGIVYDSQAADEYEEVALKARFLQALPPEFSIFETMRAGRDGIPLLEAHLARLQASAHSLGLACDLPALRAALAECCASFPDAAWRRLKLSLGANGVQLEHAVLPPMSSAPKLLVSDARCSTPHWLLRHKSSERAEYDAAWRAAEAQGAFDQLFCNAAGHVTEGGRSNLFVLLDGVWLTPPLADGLLPGVMRAQLLQELGAQERSISLAELRRAEQVMLCNALRGAFVVGLQWLA
ncbi:chorismate-binding protein [Massilia sp. W12]|uniref:bifunctional chorismate-binding protein/class IV aminotransferase n=1 Tax=Massilia sp. W12 TaxID=3126507 RepID=UPI0030CEA983